MNKNVWFQKISMPTHMDGHWKFRGRGDSKTKIFKGKYEA